MSTKYKSASEVPNADIVTRLRELSEIVRLRPLPEHEFTMRVPAELDRDADLVLSIAASRITELEQSEREAVQQLQRDLDSWMNEAAEKHNKLVQSEYRNSELQREIAELKIKAELCPICGEGFLTEVDENNLLMSVCSACDIYQASGLQLKVNLLRAELAAAKQQLAEADQRACAAARFIDAETPKQHECDMLTDRGPCKRCDFQLAANAARTAQSAPAEWIDCSVRLPTIDDAGINGLVEWLRSGVICRNTVAGGRPIDATHWRCIQTSTPQAAEKQG